MSDQQVSGSYQVNPTPKNIQIKDRAKFHKNVSSKTIREIIDESIADQSKPKATQV